MRKPAITLICILLMLAMLCGCDKKESADVDLHSLREKMLAASELPEMKSADSSDERAERNLLTLTDVKYDKVEDYFIDYAADGAAYEIAVIRMRSRDDAPAVKKDLEDHIANRAKQYRYYDPDQLPNAEKAIVAENGAYVALIMCDDPDAVKKAFDAAF